MLPYDRLQIAFAQLTIDMIDLRTIYAMSNRLLTMKVIDVCTLLLSCEPITIMEPYEVIILFLCFEYVLSESGYNPDPSNGSSCLVVIAYTLLNAHGQTELHYINYQAMTGGCGLSMS